MITIATTFFVQNLERNVLLRPYLLGLTPSRVRSCSAAEGADTRIDSATSSISSGASTGPLGPNTRSATVLCVGHGPSPRTDSAREGPSGPCGSPDAALAS